MTSTGEWIKSRGRCHPNLKLIDEALRHELKYSDLQPDAIGATLNYKVWEKDCSDAQEEHLHNKHDLDFDRMAKGMKWKQAMRHGDRTRENLQFLDALPMSYPGWKEDAREFVAWHVKGYDVTYLMRRMHEKQRMSEGVRTHPRLASLDSLRLTYPGWKRDVDEAEKLHLSIRELSADGMTDGYRALLANLASKQRRTVAGLRKASSMNPVPRNFVDTRRSCPGWQDSAGEGEESFCVSLFERDLDKCRNRQIVPQNDFRHHPALMKLNGIKLSYPGWQADVENAKVCLSSRGYANYFAKKEFDSKIEGMKRKQDAFDRVGTERKKTGKKEYQFGSCQVCCDAPRTHAFVPCGHLCACQSCSQKLIGIGNSRCPICKQNATMAMEVFLP